LRLRAPRRSQERLRPLPRGGAAGSEVVARALEPGARRCGAGRRRPGRRRVGRAGPRADRRRECRRGAARAGVASAARDPGWREEARGQSTMTRLLTTVAALGALCPVSGCDRTYLTPSHGRSYREAFAV